MKKLALAITILSMALAGCAGTVSKKQLYQSLTQNGVIDKSHDGWKTGVTKANVTDRFWYTMSATDSSLLALQLFKQEQKSSTGGPTGTVVMFDPSRDVFLLDKGDYYEVSKLEKTNEERKADGVFRMKGGGVYIDFEQKLKNAAASPPKAYDLRTKEQAQMDVAVLMTLMSLDGEKYSKYAQYYYPERFVELPREVKNGSAAASDSAKVSPVDSTKPLDLAFDRESDKGLHYSIKSSVTPAGLLLTTFKTSESVRYSKNPVENKYTIVYDPETSVMMTYHATKAAVPDKGIFGGESISVYIFADSDIELMINSLFAYMKSPSKQTNDTFIAATTKGGQKLGWTQSYDSQDGSVWAKDLINYFAEQSSMAKSRGSFAVKGAVLNFAAEYAAPAQQVLQKHLSESIATMYPNKSPYEVWMNFTQSGLNVSRSQVARFMPMGQLFSEISEGSLKQNWDWHEAVVMTVLKFREPAFQADLKTALAKIASK